MSPLTHVVCVHTPKAMHRSRNNLLETKTAAQERVEIHRRILTDLDELGTIMTDMLEQQHAVEVRGQDLSLK